MESVNPFRLALTLWILRGYRLFLKNLAQSLVLEDGKALPEVFLKRKIQIGRKDSFFAAAATDQHFPPWIKDQTGAETADLIAWMNAHLSRSNHKSLILNGPGPQKDFPMGFAGVIGKIGGHE